MARVSLLSLLRHGAGMAWGRQWRDAAPNSRQLVVMVGAGGHGLATAYYLAKQRGIRDIAALDKWWLGGGNTGRNTTIIRSDYLQPERVRRRRNMLRERDWRANSTET